MDKVSFKGTHLNFYKAPNTSLEDRNKLAQTLLRQVSDAIGGSAVKDDTFVLSNEANEVEAQAFDIIRKPLFSFFGKVEKALKVFVVHDKKDSTLEMLTVSKDKYDDLVSEIHSYSAGASMPHKMILDGGLKVDGVSFDTNIKNASLFEHEVERLSGRVEARVFSEE